MHPFLASQAHLCLHVCISLSLKSNSDVCVQTVEKPPFFMHAQDLRQVIHINYFSAVVRFVAPPAPLGASETQSLTDINKGCRPFMGKNQLTRMQAYLGPAACQERKRDR